MKYLVKNLVFIGKKNIINKIGSNSKTDGIKFIAKKDTKLVKSKNII